MKIILLLFLHFFFLTTAYSQCVQGDCQNGFGKLFAADHSYDGSFKDGKYHGMGMVKYYNEDVFKGSFVNGMRHGVGILTLANKTDIVYAQFENDKVHGMSFMTRNGEFVEALKFDEGVQKKAYTDYNIDDFLNGCRGNCMKGFGLRIWAENDYFFGFFWGSQPDSVGIRVYPSGAIYKGGHSNGFRDGYGEYYYTDGASYIGEWKRGDREGYGVYTTPEGQENTGVWKNDKMITKL